MEERMTKFGASCTGLLALGLAAACGRDSPSNQVVAPDAVTDGCARRRGDVNFAEFNAENNSTLAASVVGHMAWRMDPTYVKIVSGRTIRVRNEGGRAHTFTKVAQFGGGKIPNPSLNKGLVTAPECPGSTDIPPGGSAEVSGLAVGNNRFQCCIHPWMRAIVKGEAG